MSLAPRSILLVALLAPIVCACHSKARQAPPPEIQQLEREVALKLAHVRDEGPEDSQRRERLSAAHDADLRAEQEIERRDFTAAEADLIKAKSLLADIHIDTSGD